jgi:hypothetical protein
LRLQRRQGQRHALGLVDAAVAYLGFAGGRGRETGRDAVVDHIDQPAYRAGSIQQRGGAAQDLDLACGRRVGRYGVVIRQRRDVGHRHAVLQHLDPGAVEPTDDGPGRAGAEAGTGHAKLVGQCLAQRAGLAVAQFVAGHDPCRRQDLVVCAAGQRTGGDDDFGQRIGCVGGVDGLCMGGAGEQHGARHRGTWEGHGYS